MIVAILVVIGLLTHPVLTVALLVVALLFGL
jgi:hypothetical protein